MHNDNEIQTNCRVEFDVKENKNNKKLVGLYLRCTYNHVLLEKKITALSNSNSRVASLTVTLTFHMELVNYGFDTRYAVITLYVVTLRHIPSGGYP